MSKKPGKKSKKVEEVVVEESGDTHILATSH